LESVFRLKKTPGGILPLIHKAVGRHFIPLARGQACRRNMTVGPQRACPRLGGV